MHFALPTPARSSRRTRLFAWLPVAMIASLLAVIGSSTAGGAATLTKTYDCANGYQVPTEFTLNNAPTTMYVNETSSAAQGSLKMTFPANSEVNLVDYTKPFTIPEGQPLAGTVINTNIKWIEVGGSSVAGSFGGKPTALSFRFAKEEVTKWWNIWPPGYVSDGWTWTSPATAVPLTAPATPGSYPVTFGNFSLPLAMSGPLKILGITAQDEVPLGTDTWECVGPQFSFANIRVKSRSHVSFVLSPSSVQQGTRGSAQASVTVDGGTATGRVEYFAVAAPSTVLATANVVNGASAAVDLSLLPAGEHEIGARFVPADTTLYDGSTAVETQVLTVRPPNATTTTLTVDPLSFLDTQGTTATAEVTSPAGTPAGSVIFTLNGVDKPAQTLVQGKTTLAISGLAKGDHTIAARFVPANADVYAASDSITRTMNVTKLPDGSATSVTITPNPAFTTDAVTATANVSIFGGAAADGTVDWTIVGTDAGNTVFETPSTPVGAGGLATLDLSHLGAGSYDVTADFSPTPGADQAPSSTTSATSLVVKRPPATTTTTAVALSSGSVWTGESVTATATVTPTVPLPEGEVVFTIDGVDQAPVTLPASGVVTTVLDDLQPPSHSVSARFVPTDAAVFTPSASADKVVVVQNRPPVVTTTTIALDPASASITEDDTITATANVTAPEGTLAGEVEFRVQPNSGPALTYTKAYRPGGVPLVLDGLAAGPYTVSARFTPAAGTNFTVSTSGSLPLTVTLPPAAISTTTLALSRTTATTLDTVTATASVATGRGAAVGKVEFTSGTTTTRVDVVDGVATLALGNLPVGTNTVSARFIPTYPARQLPSNAADKTVEVVAAPDAASVTTLSLSRITMPANGTAVASAQVSSTGGTPAGEVVFKVDGVEVARRVLTGGGAEAPLSGLTVGARSVTAQFVPTAGNKVLGSTSQAVALTVEPAAGPRPSTSVMTLSKSAVHTGQNFTATVKVAAAGATPQGAVDFTFAGQTTSVPVNASGEAALTLTAAAIGTFPVKAVFRSGSAEVADSTAPELSVVVSDASSAVTSTTLSADHDEITVGDAVELTATVTSSGSVDGTVKFLLTGGAELTSATVDPATSTATAPVSSLVAGDHEIVAQFVPADLDAVQASTSDSRSVKVRAGSAVVLSLGSVTAVEGVAVNASAAVTTVGGPAAGVVEFLVGGKTVSSNVSNGGATAVLPTLAPGSYDVVARFVPTSATMRTSTSSKRTLTVTAKAPTTTTTKPTPRETRVSVTVPESLAYGAGGQVTANVTGATNGVVQFAAGDFTIDVPLEDGSATVELPDTLPVGSHQVVASFVPRDAMSFAGSQATGTVTVVKDKSKLRFAKRFYSDTRVLQYRGRVMGVSGSQGTGKVTFTLFNGTKKVARVTRVLDCNGFAEALFKIRTSGKYSIKTKFAGSDTLLPGNAKLTKKIR